MMIFICSSVIGVFALDKDKTVISQYLFPKDSEKILDKLNRLEKGEMIEELESLLKDLKKKKVKNIVTDIPFKSKDFHVEVKKDTSASKYLKENLREIAQKVGLSISDLNKILSGVQILKTKEKIKVSVKKDKIVMQAISAVEDLDDITNRFSERLREWYGLYYPEFSIKDHKRYAELISEFGKREDFKDFKGSMGLDLDENDIQILKEFAVRTKKIYELKKKIEEYLEEIVPDMAPTTSYILGSLLTAKMISLAGSLEKMAKMPSSTIQLMGAEKALFRHIKGGGKPPKHGIIYQHPEIVNSPKELRGKIARAIASKVSITVKTDFYTGEFKGEEMKKDLDKKIKEIKEKG